MKIEEIRDRLRKIVVEQFSAAPARITDETKFVDDLHADSLDVIELHFAIEEWFDHVAIDDGNPPATFGDAVKLVAEQMGVNS